MEQATTSEITDNQVWAALYRVLDPEIGINIVDLGLVYCVEVEGTDVRVTMTLTTPGCPLHGSITSAVREATQWFLPAVTSVDVNLVWQPRWCPDLISEAGRRELGLC